MKKIGFTIGKFAPLHKGHQYLIETAIKQVDEMYVVIYETDVIDIPIETRADWIKKLYPKVKILYAYNPPKQFGMDDESIEIQINYLKKIIGDIPVTHFFSSEPYGKAVAEKMNVLNCQVDRNRIKVPISATKVRKNADENQKYLEEIVYKDISKIAEVFDNKEK